MRIAVALLFFVIAISFSIAAFDIGDKGVTTTSTTTNRQFPNGIDDQTTNTTAWGQSSGLVALSCAIISSACFLCSAFVFSKANPNKATNNVK